MNYNETLLSALNSLLNTEQAKLIDIDYQKKILPNTITPLCTNWNLNSDITDISELFDDVINYCSDSSLLCQQIFDLKWLYHVNKFFITHDTDILFRITEQMNKIDRFYKSRMCFIGSILYYIHKGSVNDSLNYLYIFMKAFQNISGSYVTPVFAGARACVPFPELYENINKISFNKNYQEDNISFFISANNDYIKKFLDNYINSFNNFRDKENLHLHWIIDNELEYNSIKSIINKYKNEFYWFSISEEKCPDIFDKRTYFACKRFLIANELLNCNKIIIITDIDFALIAPTKRIILENIKYDISLRINEWNEKKSFHPWMKAIANIVIMKNSYSSFLFLYIFKKQFEKYFYGNSYNWTLDQTIIGSIINSNYGKILSIGQVVTSSCFEVPWHIKNPALNRFDH